MNDINHDMHLIFFNIFYYNKQNRYKIDKETASYTFRLFTLKVTIEVDLDLYLSSSRKEFVELFYEKFTKLNDKIYAHKNIEFSLYIENEIITPTLIIPLFAVFKAATKVILRN